MSNCRCGVSVDIPVMPGVTVPLPAVPGVCAPVPCGPPGVDGYSPTAQVERIADGALITITDKNGTTQAHIYDGDVTLAQLLKAFPVDSASGTVASFPDGADGIPVKSLVLDIQPAQEGSGDPSPSNVRPIGGWTGAAMGLTGKNMLPPVTKGIGINSTTGEEMVSPTYATTEFIPIRFLNDSGLYIVTGLVDSLFAFFAYYDRDKRFLGRTGTSKRQSVILRTAAVVNLSPESVAFMRLTLYQSGTTGSIDDVDNMEAQMVPGTVSTAYEPYAGELLNVSWESEAGTVYAGSLDVTAGTLRARPYYAAYAGEALVGPWVSSMDVYAAGATPTTGAQVVDLGGAEAVHQLTPQEISTLLGVNSIWANTGPASVIYRADPTRYIDKRLAPIQALVLENGG